MALIPSSMLDLGTPLPPFTLPDAVSGTLVSSDGARGKIIVVAFLCNHCPYVKHIQSALSEFGRFCTEHDDVAFFAISSNDVSTHPEDAPDKMADEARVFGYTFPYLYDETQDVARAFEATCTPDFFVFDKEGLLRYRGQFDASRPGNGKPVTGQDLTAAVELLQKGRRPAIHQVPSIGCSIKWKQ